MSNIDSLKPFTKGDPRASAAGKKSKRKGIEQEIQDFLKERWGDKDGDERTRLDLIKEALLKYGLKGNVKAISELLDRGFGKAKQHNAIEHDGQITINLIKKIINGKNC